MVRRPHPTPLALKLRRCVLHKGVPRRLASTASCMQRLTLSLPHKGGREKSSAPKTGTEGEWQREREGKREEMVDRGPSHTQR